MLTVGSSACGQDQELISGAGSDCEFWHISGVTSSLLQRISEQGVVTWLRPTPSHSFPFPSWKECVGGVTSDTDWKLPVLWRVSSSGNGTKSS